MIYRPPIDEDTKAKAIKAYREGKRSFRAVAKAHGVTDTTLRTWVDPAYARRRKDAINKARRKT